MALPFTYATASASYRSDSDDRAAVFEHHDVLIVAIADGAGGIRGGARASAACIDIVHCTVTASRFDSIDPRAWREVLRALDADLTKHATGETTAVIVAIGPFGIHGASVGDSEAWIVNSSRIDQLTEQQDRRRLGTGHATPVLFHRPLLTGILVVATDGLFRYVSPERIASACEHGGTAERIPERLIALAHSSGEYAEDVAVVAVTPTQQRQVPSSRGAKGAESAERA